MIEMQIQSDGEEIIILKTGDKSNWLSEDQQRQLISWFWKNKTEMVREIVCENCPEVC